MTTQEQIEETVQGFVRGGDTSDIPLLDRVLNARFQNVQDGFFEEKGVFVFSKEEYKKLVKTKRFGGSSRSIELEEVQLSGNIARVSVRLESEFLIFHSILVLVREDDRWTVIHNIPNIEKK